MTETSQTTASKPRIQRIGGRLHEVRDLTDKAGKVVHQIVDPLKVELKWADAMQLLAGALVMSVPVAVTEEVWDLGETLSGWRILLIVLTSLVILSFFIRVLFYPGDKLKQYRGEFVKRLTASYLVTLAVALSLLILFDKAPLEDVSLALRRAVIVALPASLAATAVDYMK
jgi:uncharacterized membrane protein